MIATAVTRSVYVVRCASAPARSVLRLEDTMITPTPRRLCRATGVLLFCAGAAIGCGSAINQQVPRTQKASHTDATTVKTITRSTPRSPATRAGARPSGITGRVLATRCTALRGEHACPGRRVPATIKVLRAPSGDQTATVQSDAAGRFRIKVPPGAYQLLATSSDHFFYARPVRLRVRPHHFERVTVTFFLRHPLPVTPA